VALRVACSEDISDVQQFVRGLSDRSRRNRFFAPVRELSPDQLIRVTRSRPPSELSLVAETTESTGSRIVAMAQYAVCEPLDAELALVVDDTWQRQGLGIQLLGMLTEHAARAGLEALAGFVLADNWPMLALLARLDCELITDCDPYAIRVVKRLDPHEFAVDSSYCNRVAPDAIYTSMTSVEGISHVGARAAWSRAQRSAPRIV
jgi:GNAT superfamily N-acetyltransferase